MVHLSLVLVVEVVVVALVQLLVRLVQPQSVALVVTVVPMSVVEAVAAVPEQLPVLVVMVVQGSSASSNSPRNLLVADISSNNHPNDTPILWSDVVGVDAFFVKCTQSTTYYNPWYTRDIAGIKSINKPALAYHYAGFGNVNAELAWFLAHAGDLAACCDFETSTNSAWINEFLSGLEFRPNVGYGSESTFPAITADIRWKAAYGQVNPPPDCSLWQYTDSAIVPGFPEPIDLSTWLGTQAEWDSLWSLTPTAYPPLLLTGHMP